MPLKRIKAPAACSTVQVISIIHGFKKWSYRTDNRFSSNFDIDKRCVE